MYLYITRPSHSKRRKGADRNRHKQTEWTLLGSLQVLSAIRLAEKGLQLQ